MVELSEVFDVKYGNQFDLNKMDMSDDSIHFVGRSAKNNGVTAKVGIHNGITPFPEGLVTVALGGSVLASFLQVRPFYTGQNIAVLTPIISLTIAQKLFYCKAIFSNAYRFSTCGREANRTLTKLLVPSIDELPEWVATCDNFNFDGAHLPFENKKFSEFDTNQWKYFLFDELFDIRKGKRLTKSNMLKGDTRFIGAIDSNNGLREHIHLPPIHQENTITVNYNGNGVAEAFYQDEPYWCSDDVNVLYPKFELNKYIALFLCAIIRMEKYRFNYGRKWHVKRMNKSTIKLPVTQHGAPDFDIMEKYIKSLDYSNSI